MIKAGASRVSLSAKIDPSAHVEADELVIEDLAVVEAGVTIKGRRVHIGYKTKIERGSTFHALGSALADEFSFGDFTFVGFEFRGLVPRLRVGDYTALHNRTLLSGYKTCVIGHNCWVGEVALLNVAEDLTIGNNCRIGPVSQIWTHVASGELLEGCQWYGNWPVVIEDNVWLVGGATAIYPNLTLGAGSVIMTNSVVTKSTEPRRCYAGVPAKDVTDKLNPYRDLTLDEKYELMRRLLEEFFAANDTPRERILLVEELPSRPPGGGERLIIVKNGEVADLGPDVSVFSLATKHYTKKRTALEEKFIRFNVGHRARFTPVPSLEPVGR